MKETYLWEEKNSTEVSNKSENKDANVPSVIISETNQESTPSVCKDTGKRKRVRNKEQQRIYMRKYYADNQEYFKERQKEYRCSERGKKKKKEQWLRDSLNKDKIKERRKRFCSKISNRIKCWKDGARKRNISWDLTSEFIESLPRICHYTGLPLVMEDKQPNTISLERLDSSKGYEQDNVVFCCSMINRMKLNYSKDEFVRMCKAVASFNQ